jgi:hypothetical protein
MSHGTVHEDEEFTPATFTNSDGFSRIGSRRKFGIELEYTNSPCFGDLDNGYSPFGAKTDGSLLSGGEFYSTILQGDGGLNAVTEFCKFAVDNDFETGSDAGYHAHFDLNDLSVDQVKSVALSYYHTRKFWCKTVPVERIRGTWSKTRVFELSTDQITDMRDIRYWARSYPRYSWINFNAYSRFGTVESRIHEATVNPQDVNLWVIANIRFIDAVSNLTTGQIGRIFSEKSPARIFRELRCILKCPETSGHLRKRYNDHSGKSNDLDF